MADKKETFTQIVNRQHDAGTVLPADVEKYGMEQATQIAMKRAEDKARTDSTPKPTQSASNPT